MKPERMGLPKYSSVRISASYMDLCRCVMHSTTFMLALLPSSIPKQHISRRLSLFLQTAHTRTPIVRGVAKLFQYVPASCTTPLAFRMICYGVALRLV